MRTRLKMLIVQETPCKVGEEIFKKSWSHLKILGAKMVTQRTILIIHKYWAPQGLAPGVCAHLHSVFMCVVGRVGGDITYPYILIGEINCPLCCRKLEVFFCITYINFMLKGIKTFIFGPQRVDVIGRRRTT